MKTYQKNFAGVALFALLFFIPVSHVVAGVPLQILSFSAQQSDKDALLEWKTEHEGNTDYFEVERSADALVYTSVGRLSACNSEGIHYYELEDAHAGKANRILFYRLKQVDKDRNVTYTPIIKLSFEMTVNAVSLFPNPVSPQSTLKISLVRSCQIQVRILGNMGRLIRQSVYQLEEGTTPLPFDAGELLHGSYYVEVRGTAFTRIIRFVK